ncbi:MAG: S1C family serine protease [Pirellulales bacterium]
MSLPKFQQMLCWTALAVAAIGGGAVVLAQNGGFVGADQQPTGKIVPITPGGGGIVIDDAAADAANAAPPQVEVPKHWIGILLGPVSDEVRAQIKLPENEGVLVRQVLPNSPAAKGGVELFDIVLTANDHQVTSGRDLMELVQQEGTSGGKITLDVLRHGEHQSITITPEARPEPTDNDATGAPGQGWGMGGAMRGMPPMHNFGNGGLGQQFRMFAPGGAFTQGFSLSQMPNGVSVSIQKQNDEPAHITVQRGNDSWDIVGDDPKSLDQLPADVRPFVEQLLSDNSSNTMQMPSMPPMHGMMGPGMGGFNDDEMQQQLQRMEQQLQQMRMMLQRDFAPQGQSSAPIYPKAPDTQNQDNSGESDAN